MFSILTTTYNCENLIHRVYESLNSQTYLDFEWIVIDDASTDNTEELINLWKSKSNIEIIYYKMPRNQGKASCINYGIDLCKRPITINADADDTFSESTLSDLKHLWDVIDRGINPEKIGSIWTLTKDEQNNLIGEKWPKNFWQVGFNERVLLRKKNIEGEKWHSWRTDVLRKYKKYTNPNSRVSPSISWNRINKDYDFLCVNLIHRTYFHNSEGISHQKKSQLKILKRVYYSSFFEINDGKIKDILKYNYYQEMAFSYIRSSLKYTDKKLRLRGLKKIIVLILFLYKLPKHLLMKFKLKK
ncbi:glycosyltransferase involved in cell wall biosynthesis [Maribacter caenipelagi]|uniref:Glycosyltransferase involved in cell wall biosynthesis n=1 Tax=Maribacter caenipelagi TaxID=1447781 RepID=A0A4R7CYN2_9FLAO|nr:glycosyltransferase family 2 protein [Maribacter caenipelagi]TDS13440.1 glycosyltransferase involved in cell wall biosynthesis [Maribacter caenipelagi]